MSTAATVRRAVLFSALEQIAKHHTSRDVPVDDSKTKVDLTIKGQAVVPNRFIRNHRSQQRHIGDYRRLPNGALQCKESNWKFRPAANLQPQKPNTAKVTSRQSSFDDRTMTKTDTKTTAKAKGKPPAKTKVPAIVKRKLARQAKDKPSIFHDPARFFPKCGSTERTDYANTTGIAYNGIHEDRKYIHVVWWTTSRKKRGQRRRYRSFEISKSLLRLLMPGRLRTNFRTGNLAEHLGLLLLKGISAVAEVARPEDVGLDAIATLLRRANDGNCYAEDTFVVQLKSESEESLSYKDHQLDWLVGQSQPMFIGRVSLRSSQISLYPTLFVNQAVLSLHAKAVSIRFGNSDLPSFLHGQKHCPWTGTPDGANVWLGDPLLQWSIHDLVDKNWVQLAYTHLKTFLAVARRELDLLSFGQCSSITWTTNVPDSITADWAMLIGQPDEYASLVSRCAPVIRSLFHHAMTLPMSQGNPVMESLVQLVAVLRESGVDIDKANLFLKMYYAQKFLSTTAGSDVDSDDGQMSMGDRA